MAPSRRPWSTRPREDAHQFALGQRGIDRVERAPHRSGFSFAPAMGIAFAVRKIHFITGISKIR